MKESCIRLSVIIMLFAYAASAVQAKQIDMESISVTDGLASNSVYAIVQDCVGYMWFGTINGLNRYDGKVIKTYQPSPNKENSISDSKINCLMSTRSGELLIGTGKGLNIYVRERDEVVPYAPSAMINKEVIRSLAEDSLCFWVGTNMGLFRLNKNDGRITTYNVRNSGLSNNIIRAIFVDGDYLYVGTFDGLSRFNKKSEKWSSVNLKPSYIKFPQNNLVLAIEQSPFNTDQLLVGTQTGLCELDKSTLSYELHETSRNKDIVNNTIKTICTVTNNVWLGSEEGVMTYDNENFNYYGYNPSNPHSLPNNIVWSIYKDRGNIVWLGTDAGVAKYDAGIPEFNYVDLTKADGNKFLGMSIFAAQMDSNGVIWMGSRFGLSCYNPKSNTMRWIALSNMIEGTYNFIRGLYLDKNEVLWVGTAEGLVCYDTRLGSEIPIQRDLEYRLKYINEVKQIDSTLICVCDAMGRIQLIKFEFDQTGRAFTSVDDEFIALGEPVGSMTVDEGSIWLSADGGGLVRYDRDNSSTQRYRSIVGDTTSLSCDNVNYVFFDKNTQTLWVGSDKGLDKYDREADNFVRVSSHDALNSVYTIDTDSAGLLWLSTRNSIVCYEPSRGKFNFFPLKHWMDISKNIPRSSFSDDSGNVYIMGLDGYVCMNYANVKQKRVSASLCITDIMILNRPIADYGLDGNKQIDKLEKITLNHNQNVLAFYFSMLDYSSPSSVRYLYKLANYDAQWRTIDGTMPCVEYSRLPRGKYTLYVEAVSSEGIKASNSIVLEIEILPAWWLCWWAYVIYVILFLGAAYFIYSTISRRRDIMDELRHEKIQREKVEEINLVKQQLFTNISHDFKTPLSLIISPVESILEHETDQEKINNLKIVSQNARRLLNLVNQIIDFRKVDSHNIALNLESADIVETIKNLCSTFKELADKKGVTFIFEAGIDHLKMSFDMDKMERIIVNLISNAIQFTPEGGEMIVSIQRKDIDSLEIMIADTGIGIPNNDLPYIFDRFYMVEEHAHVNTKGSGIGLTIVKEFVNLHQGEIKVLSKSNVGTTFFVRLPIVDEDSDGVVVAEQSMVDHEYTLLIVEDNDDMRNYLKTQFEKVYNVIAVADAESGYKIVRDCLPDIVVSDVMLPGMSGVDMCRLIKDTFVTSHIPVILLTAKSAEENVIEGFEVGADEYIGKPFNMKLLLSRVENIIVQRQKFRDNLKRDTIEISALEMQSPDQVFINKVVTLIEQNMSDPDLNIQYLCDQLAVSHVNFYRKIKSITGMNVNAFIRDIKLKKAVQLLRVKGFSVTDVMYEVGFNHRSYFSMCFRDMFGVTPKAYAQQHNNSTVDDDKS